MEAKRGPITYQKSHNEYILEVGLTESVCTLGTAQNPEQY